MKEPHEISKQSGQVIQNFIHVLTTQKDLSAKTLREYASDLKHFIGWFTANDNEKNTDLPIDHIATATLVRYREAMQDTMGLKPATINRRLITLKRFFEWAASEGIIALDPSKPVKLLPEDKEKPRKMTNQEEEALISATRQYGSLRDQAIVFLMLHTGLWPMEVCDLKPEDIRLDTPSHHVIVQSGVRNNYREVPLNAACRVVLEDYMSKRSPNSTYLFSSEKTGDRLTERALRHLIQKYMKAAHLEGLQAHHLRHRFGYVMAATTPVDLLAQIMGHDRQSTTMIYINAIGTELP
ncbi:tyrosine-type recombinase/integrase [Paenibacillus senegalimassiliensis]|uniref:tyrosine-type recombinase/integrase n=1 Tax=Paenibacillus senegalimassiliensis TaxID=1737426 RepID=UPI00073EDC90|nr:tyrosine-type recombinase/integrase [Paenibacillus senegalimassiliensis]